MILPPSSYSPGLRTASDVRLKATHPKGTGPALLEDQVAMEKIHRFDHERIPERIVHARGAGAHGHFHVFDDRASKYTFAPVLTDPSRSTPVFVRFSTVQGPRGSADTVRDVRGFATKFYTPEGNWDIVGYVFGFSLTVILVSLTRPPAETIFRCSSSRMPCSSPTLFTPSSPSLTTRCPLANQHTTTSGTSSPFSLKLPTLFSGP